METTTVQVYRPGNLSEFLAVPNGEFVELGKMNSGLAMKLASRDPDANLFVQRKEGEKEIIRELEGHHSGLSFVGGRITVFGGIYDDIINSPERKAIYLEYDRLLKEKGR